MRLEFRPPTIPLPTRLEVHRKLGEGAFGNVYEVYDREERSRVALKSLERLDAHSLFRFKREFRELADITHPNLVRLHELFCFHNRWYFTMELVRGVSFIEYVRPGVIFNADDPTLAPVEAQKVAAIESMPGQGKVDEVRLRTALVQLVEGVAALHLAGKLHRDLKPQNVLVQEDGRVLVLDFGLLDDIHAEASSRIDPDELVGTPAYMAPESAAVHRESPASDWYAVGAMLYEALAGRLPFEGKPMSMLLQKQTEDPPTLQVDDSMADLAQLAMLLLARDPEQRPSLATLRANLRASVATLDHCTATETCPQGSVSSQSSDTSSSSLLTRQPTEFLIGREVEFELLVVAFQRVTQGHGVLLRVFGRSGIGKSALVRFFVEDLKRSRQAICLRGRCFECESVPYKALDSLVDALTQHLTSMSVDEVSVLLPTDVTALARLFPVLRRIGPIAEAVRNADFDRAEPQEVRLAAFAALRTMLRRLAELHPLVLWIDDLQWGDEDSADFLASLLAPPDDPKLLLIISHRVEDTDTSGILRVLLQSLREANYDHRELEVGPLAEADCQKLATLLAKEQSNNDSQPPPEIASESGGSPLFLIQLVRHAFRVAAGEVDATASPSVRLDDVLWQHACSLPASAQRLLHTVSVAGRSIELSIARQAADVIEELRDSLDVLRMQRLVRTQGLRNSDLVEPYHDRIREVV
ncbi:MAG: hypothetical protein CSA75_02955, partial [Sorangium cellulosum]